MIRIRKGDNSSVIFTFDSSNHMIITTDVWNLYTEATGCAIKHYFVLEKKKQTSPWFQWKYSLLDRGAQKTRSSDLIEFDSKKKFGSKQIKLSSVQIELELSLT